MKRIVVLLLLLIGLSDLVSSLLSNVNDHYCSSIHSNDQKKLNKHPSESDSASSSHTSNKSSDCHDCLHQCHLGHCFFISVIQSNINILHRNNNQKIFSPDKFFISHYISVENPPPILS